MNAFIAFTKKEWLETIRSGKLVILTVLFLLFGIMNPAIAKLTPWMMELMSESLSGTGLIVTQIQVDALVSWTQFFKNIPIALIAFNLQRYFYKGISVGNAGACTDKGIVPFKGRACQKHFDADSLEFLLLAVFWGHLWL